MRQMLSLALISLQLNEPIKQGRPTFAALVLKSICSWLNESLVLPAFVEDVAKFKGPARFV
jgi:hypothetical protein